MVLDDQGRPVDLPRALSVLDVIQREYAGRSRERWRDVAVLSLHELCGWTHREIGFALGVSPMLVTRALRRVRKALRNSTELRRLMDDSRRRGDDE